MRDEVSQSVLSRQLSKMNRALASMEFEVNTVSPPQSLLYIPNPSWPK